MPITTAENNKRIAHNTIFLYIRMFVVMGVSFYTTRIVLKLLGVDDYGILSVVAGIVVMFGFFNTAMVAATQRFLNFEIGKGQPENVSCVFSVSVVFFLLLIPLAVLLGETVGLWLLNGRLNIPPARLAAANWIFQLTLAGYCFKVIQIPYNALIIAYEKMSFYSFISILESLLLLLNVWLLFFLSGDKLILYVFMTSVTSLIVFLFYRGYCRRKFPQCQFSFRLKMNYIKEIFSFSGWSLLGTLANVAKHQGIIMIVNIFCGVAVSGALGIANQVGNAINVFVANFQVAFNPQIVKSYAAGECHYFTNLVFSTSKYSFFLLWLLVLPFWLEAEFALKLWLGNVPDYVVIFTQLTMLCFLIDTMSAPLWMAAQTIGTIRNYQLIISGLILLSPLFSYLFLRLHYSPSCVMIVCCVINLFCHVARIVYLKCRIQFPVMKYLYRSMLPILAVFTGSFLFSLLLKRVLVPLIPNPLLSGIVLIIASSLINFIFIFRLGLSEAERKTMYSLLARLRKKYHICNQISGNLL